MILVDSSVWIDYFNGIDTWQTARLDQLLAGELLFTVDIIIAEVLQGFRSDSDFEKAKLALAVLPCYPLSGYDVAVQSAFHYRRLRQLGVTIRKTVDMIIATFCIQHQYHLLHNNKDFDDISKHLGLLVIAP